MDQLPPIMENLTITSTPDGKSKRSQLPPTNFETPSKQNMSTTNVFINGSLDEQKQAVHDDLGPIPEVTVDFMLEHIVPKLNIDVDSTMKKLKDAGTLTELAEGGHSWKAFDGKSPVEIHKLKQPDTDSEAKIFGKLNEIYRSIISCTQFHDKMPRTPTLEFKQDPNRAPASNSSNKTRPDGYGVLKQSMTIPGNCMKKPSERDGEYTLYPEKPVLEDPNAVQWYDIGFVEEYKIKNSSKDRNDNVLKILWGLHHIMSLDHRRRFIFGITIENTDARVWFACRQIVFVTETFRIVQDTSKLIRLIASLAFATPTQLGYDPTMSLYYNKSENYYYHHIQCRSKNPDGSELSSVYLVNEVISNYAFNLRGRATRVYNVTLLVKNANGSLMPSGHEFVLKDSWVDTNRTKEGDTYQQLLADASQGDKDRFLSVFQHGVVKVDDQEDSTDVVMLKGHTIEIPEEKWLVGQDETSTDENSNAATSKVGIFYLSVSENTSQTASKATHPNSKRAKTKSSKPSSRKERTSQMLGSARGGLKHNTHKAVKRPIVCSPKVHYRVVFKGYHGVSLEQVLDRGEATSQIMHKALRDIVEALQFMAKRGFVHRDVSIANILWYSDGQHAKLIDLDFAKPYATETSSFVRTGTYAFMASEIMKRKYSIPEFARRNANIPLAYNPVHDLESLWWVGVYWLICHYPAPYDTVVSNLPSGEFRTTRNYRHLNDKERGHVKRLLAVQSILFPSLYESSTFDIRMEEIHNETQFQNRVPDDFEFPTVVQALRSCLDNLRKCISLAYEEIQRELPRTEAGYFTDVLRITDPTISPTNNQVTPAGGNKKPVYDKFLEIFDILGQTSQTEGGILWPLSSTTEEREAWVATQASRSRLRPRKQARGTINMDSYQDEDNE